MPLSHPRHATALAVLLAALLLVAVLANGTVPMVIFGHDAIGILDGASRLRNGIHPSGDFYSPLGPLVYAIVALGGIVGGFSKSFPTAYALMGLLLVTVAIRPAFSRLSSLGAVVFVVLLISSATAAHQVRFPASAATYACLYNRWGEGLLAVGWCLLLGPASPDNTRPRLDGAILGSILGTLLFLKVSFGVVLMAQIIALLLFGGLSKTPHASSTKAALASCLAFILACGCLIGWRYDLYITDIWTSAHTRQQLNLSGISASLRVLDYQFWALLVLTAIRLVAEPSPARLATLFHGTSLSLATLLVTMTNTPLGHDPEAPLLGLAAILMACRPITAPRTRRLRWHACWLVAAGAMLLASPMIFKNVRSLELARELTHRAFPPQERFRQGFLNGLVLLGYAGDPPLSGTYVTKVEDGVALLVATQHHTDPVIALDFSNPLNLARGVVGPRGAPTFLQTGISMNSEFAPAPERVFAGARAVLIPRVFGDGHPQSISNILYHYSGFLKAHYQFTARSREWFLFELRPGVRVPP